MKLATIHGNQLRRGVFASDADARRDATADVAESRPRNSHVQTSVAANNSKDVDMQQVTQDAPERATAKSAPAAKRRRSLRIADSALVITLIASYATSGGAVAIHATVSLVFTAAVGWHFWLHRKWFKSVKKRLAKTRTTRSRRSATINVLIFGELTLAIVLGIVAWLGPRSLSGPHAVLANIMVGIAIVHIALNARQLKALIRRCPPQTTQPSLRRTRLALRRGTRGTGDRC